MPEPLPIAVRVVQKRLEAEDIVSLRLERSMEERLPAYTPGAHIDVEIGGKTVRQYSLCGQDRSGAYYEIAVLREPASRGGSAGLHDAVQVGQWVRISEPRNHFPLQEQEGFALLFAGGIGVTPIMVMAEALADRGQPFALHYCARAADRMAYRQRLSRLEGKGAVHFHLDDGPANQQIDIEAVLRAAPEGAAIYVCGPSGFITAILAGAERLGWNPALLHKEFFAAPAGEGEQKSDQPFMVRLARSGRDLSVNAGQSLAQALEQAGVIVPISCSEGICGTCVISVLDGQPDHRDFVLSEAEHAANDRMTPCCSRALSECLVLDL